MKPVTPAHRALRSTRRRVLKGLFGVTFALPFLEGLVPRRARAQSVAPDAYAIFFRQANGVAQANTNGELGAEPERFFPTTTGALTDATLAGRALDELASYKDRLLVLRNVNMFDFPYGDGHARGCMQGLTGRGPTVDNAGGDSEAAGESLDHRIGAELNADGRESLYMFCGQQGGWLNGPSISYRSAGVRRTALQDPFNAYVTLFGTSSGNEALEAQIAARGRSVNDLVREQLTTLRASPKLSRLDLDRLDLHLASVRDLEVDLSCRLSANEELLLQGAAPGFNSTDGDQVLETARLHMDVAAIAVACGLTRSVAIQVGVGNDGNTRYRRPDGSQMENYHFISHRRLSHDSSGSIISDGDVLHHEVDRQFAQTFRHLLDKLAAVPMPDGTTLLEKGVTCWYNDNSNGPPHGARNVPWVIAGSAGGFLRQGVCHEISGGTNAQTHTRLLNTIGSAVGLRKSDGTFIDDHGDPSLPRAVLDELLA